MDYIKEYKSFVNSYYVSEGIRITVGLTLPAVVFSFLGNLSVGIIISLGASCTMMVDNAGPIHHRRNAMLICDLLIFLVAMITGFIAPYHLLLGILILVFCFSFSMLGVYGSRASSIGLASLFVMVLNIQRENHGWQVLLNACYVLAGGLWYTMLSLALYTFRPYKLAQQAIGECLQSEAEYLRIKAAFYTREADKDEIYAQLLRQQSTVHEQQDLIRELLFKSRIIVKDSTAMGRMLILMFQDMMDLFNALLSAPQNENLIHRLFDDTKFIEEYRNMILLLADELNEIGISVKSGQASKSSDKLNKKIASLRNDFIQYRKENLSPENVEGIFALRLILENLEDIAARFSLFHRYTTYDNLISKSSPTPSDYDQFVTRQVIDPKLLLDQMTIHSNIFRHSLRVAIAAALGYFVSTFFPFGHGYWILLTIIAILKPTYGITKKRNYDRLLGTIAGAMIGILVLYFVKNRDAIFACMVICMIGAYSFMRTRYLIFILLLTPYILLLFDLLDPIQFRVVIADRVMDTAIGSGIAFLANFFILPAWEHEHIADYLINMTTDARIYFRDLLQYLSEGDIRLNQYRLSRKKVFVSLANLSDAFNRMLSEPKRKQKNIRELSQIVVLHQLLISHTATLLLHAKKNPAAFDFKSYHELTDEIQLVLKNTEAILKNEEIAVENPGARESLLLLNRQIDELMETRKSELRMGMTDTKTRKMIIEFKPVADELIFIAKITKDLEKNTAQYVRIQAA